MQNSKIEWTHHTFNPWWGCQRVSPGCEHCYAETLAHRYGHDVWGPAKTTHRRMMSENYWKQPHRWNKAAEAAGERQRVFCASMADVFEDHPDLHVPRRRLWETIQVTPWLDWLLLTKRPENMRAMLPPNWLERPLPNVWLGTSAEDQKRFDERISPLLSTPAVVHFLSCEPLLGPIQIGGYRPSWVIVGGESGHGARPMHPDWARSLRDQCAAAGVAFHFKQWGEYQYGNRRVQQEPDGSLTFHDDGMPLHVRVGKKDAGRVLDGRTWDELPVYVGGDYDYERHTEILRGLHGPG